MSANCVAPETKHSNQDLKDYQKYKNLTNKIHLHTKLRALARGGGGGVTPGSKKVHRHCLTMRDQVSDQYIKIMHQNISAVYT
jgi:hypothetical protein